MFTTRNLYNTTGGFEFCTERLVFLPFQARSLPRGAPESARMIGSSNAERNLMNFYIGEIYEALPSDCNFGNIGRYKADTVSEGIQWHTKKFPD
jgi:hypothetical protein